VDVSSTPIVSLFRSRIRVRILSEGVTDEPDGKTKIRGGEAVRVREEELECVVLRADVYDRLKQLSAEPSGHHAACQRGAVFATRTSALVKLPATARLVRVGRCFRDARPAGRGGGARRVFGGEHRSTETSSAVAFSAPARSAIAFPIVRHIGRARRPRVAASSPEPKKRAGWRPFRLAWPLGSEELADNLSVW